jgi:Domain of unknown function (DUF4352)
MRLPIVLILTGSVLLGHAMGVPSIAPQAQPVQANQGTMPWKFWIGARSWQGRTMTTNVYGSPDQHEAAEMWLAVDLTIQNATGSRKSTNGAMLWSLAELVDTTGNVYKADWGASTMEYQDTAFQAKPFGPGEVRKVRLVFDVPGNVQIAKLRFSAEDSRGESQDIEIRY